MNPSYINLPCCPTAEASPTTIVRPGGGDPMEGWQETGASRARSYRKASRVRRV